MSTIQFDLEKLHCEHRNFSRSVNDLETKPKEFFIVHICSDIEVVQEVKGLNRWFSVKKYIEPVKVETLLQKPEKPEKPEKLKDEVKEELKPEDIMF